MRLKFANNLFYAHRNSKLTRAAEMALHVEISKECSRLVLC